MQPLDVKYLFYAAARPGPQKLELLSVGHFVASAGFDARSYLKGWHREHVIYTVRGSAFADIGGRRSRAGAGSLWMFPKEAAYRYWIDPRADAWEGYWLEYDGLWTRHLWDMMGLIGTTQVRNCQTAGAVIEDIIARVRAEGDGAAHGCTTAIFRLLATLEASVQRRPTPRSGHARMLAQVHDFVKRHYSERLALADLAEAAGLSPFHFSRVFTAQSGITPAAYLRGFRIGRAQELLRMGELSVKQVARACGFTTLSHFSAVFKAVTGHSPREFVRLHHGQA
jgi:AraC-like DNA-binding protein